MAAEKTEREVTVHVTMTESFLREEPPEVVRKWLGEECYRTALVKLGEAK